MKLTKTFYTQPTLQVAKNLLGKYLIRKINGKKLVGKIVETEAYLGKNDLASHASRGRTKRTELMFGPPGFAYIYLIYGMYYCLNIVTGKKEYPAAVLIRAVEPISGISPSIKTNGPGKLCQAFLIDKKLNGENLVISNRLWIGDREERISNNQIVKAKRIGIDYAGPYKEKLWRFYIKDNPFVSKKNTKTQK